MVRPILMYQWKVNVSCTYQNLKYNKEVVVFARNRREAAKFAIKSAKESDSQFSVGRIGKVKFKDIQRYV